MSPIVNLQLVVKCKKRSFHSFKVEVALLRYIVFYCELGCDTSEPHVSYISRACSSLVRQPYYAPNCIILKISGLVVVLTVRKVHWAGRASNQPSGLLLSARVPAHRNVKKCRMQFMTNKRHLQRFRSTKQRRRCLSHFVLICTTWQTLRRCT